MKRNSAFTRSYTENPIWYQQFDLRQFRLLRGGQPTVDFDATDSFRLYVATMKAMNFQDDVLSLPIDSSKDHYVLVLDLTSMQDATDNCHHPELVGEPLRLELNFTFPLEHVTEIIVLGERVSSVAVDKLGVDGKTFKMDNVSLQQIINRIPLLKCRYRGSFPFDYVPTLDNDTFAIINKQSISMQGEHWIMIANSRPILYFQTLLVVQITVSSNSKMNRWCQNPYSPMPAFAASTQYKQLFISLNSDKKKLQEFTILMNFQS